MRAFNIAVVPMMDVRDPIDVEVVVNEKGDRLWVNIEGICRLRVQGIRTLVVVNQAELETAKVYGERT